MFKHLNMTNYQSGLRTLFNSEIMHDSHYKQVSLEIVKERLANGEEKLATRWKIAYVTERNTKDFSSPFESILQSKVDHIVPCANCDRSSIKIHTGDKGNSPLVYENEPKTIDIDQLKTLDDLDLSTDS